MAKEGCDLNGNGYPYPYVLLTKDGTDLEDEKEYTVVICGFLKGMEDELNQQDTGICLLYTSPSPRDAHESRMPSSA